MKTLRLQLTLAAVAVLFAACGEPASDGDAPAAPPQTAESEPAGLESGSFHATLNGFDIHYEVHGAGPGRDRPVVMTLPNSWGLTLDGLRALYRPLEARLTMVYFDPRGMGASGPVREDADRSMAAVRADFDALRRHLGLDKVHALGWSNGAMNLIYLAAEKPEILESAIFLHGSASYRPEDQQRMLDEHPELARRYGEFFGETQAADVDDAERDARLKRFVIDEWFVGLWASPEVGRIQMQAIYRDTGFSWRHMLHANGELEAGFDATALLPAIGVRSLVLAGAHDMMPPERVRELHDGLPDSRFVVLESSGHYAPLEEPVAFATAVLDFLGLS